MFYFLSRLSPESSLLQKVCVSRQQVQVELLERDEVERELGLVKGWIQDTQGLLLSPTADLDSLLSDLEVKWNQNTRLFLFVLITHAEFFASSRYGICEKNV